MNVHSGAIIRKESLVGCFFDDIEAEYTFTQELGSGAFGKVYEVQHKETKKFYACKRLSKRKIKNKESIIMEINLLKQLDHPNIVKLFEVYEDKVYLYLVMEELKGGELFDRILERAQNNNYYSEKEVAKLFKQILSGIAYCHSIGVVHRDIKPENIVFSEKSENSSVKLIDFGLSKTFESSKKHNMETRVGTCFYMSPEVIKGNYDEKCDVWSLGILLYVLISGRAPFNAPDDNQIIKKILDGKFEFKWSGWSKISDDCKNLIKDILVEHSKRPTAQDILNSTWIANEAPNGSDTPISIEMEEIFKFGKLDKINKAVSNFIALRLNDDEVKGLNSMFQSLDKNGDGCLCINELKSGLEKLKTENNININEDQLVQMFEAIDIDRNGFINYNEFIAATFDRKKANTKENLLQAFKTFDKDKSGKISLKELEKMFIAENSDDVDEIKNLFLKLDKNGDGEIDFDEFLANFSE